MSTPARRIAHAVLLVDGAYVLQLRDDIPGIAARGMYAFFGGSLEDGETPEAGLRREIAEELGLQLPACWLLWQVDRHSEFWGTVLRYWFFVADVTALWPLHIVKEGQAAVIASRPIRPKPRRVIAARNHAHAIRGKPVGLQHEAPGRGRIRHDRARLGEEGGARRTGPSRSY
jgi:8-oxo-dGTP pyrophosphatase MutT (NUDIX family)